MPGEVATEKPPEEAPEEDKNKAPAAKSVVGIIYPPPEVRNIVDKTADFVARNGLEFEDRIRINEVGNSKFNFLKPNNPYNAYYKHKIKEVQEGVAEENAALAEQSQSVLKQVPIAVAMEPEPPKEPPPEVEFLAEPPSISSMELDIVKLTAQFVARNGVQFLDKLMVREQRNYQFDFLRKQHPLFNYFTKLVEQYSKILLPPHERLHQLKREMENPYLILDQVQCRVEWTQFQERQKRRVEEEEEKQRVEYSQVDWHEFILVETITFRENETGYLPPPIRPSQLAQRLLQQQKYERMADEGGEVEEIEMEVEESAEDMDEEKEKEASPPPPRPPSPPPLPPPAQPLHPAAASIRRDYNPKVAPPPPPPSSQQFLISPITGEKIPADKIEEHMRYGLLDPRWIENQRRQMEDKKTEEAFSEGVQVQQSLQDLAARRTDIFGVEETFIGQKIGDGKSTKKTPSVQWDGHSGSAEIVSRMAQSNITNEQIEAHRMSQGLIPDPEKDKIGPAITKAPSSSPSSLPLPTPPHSLPSHFRPPQPPMARPPSGFHRPPNQPPHPRSYPPNHPLMSSPPIGAGGGVRMQRPPPGAMGFRPLHNPMPHNMPQQRPPEQIPRPGHPQQFLRPGPPGPIPRPGPPGPMFRPGPPPASSVPITAPLLQQPLNSAPPVRGLQPFPPINLAPDVPLDMAPLAAKKARSEADDLIPEQEFIAKNSGPVTFTVQVPNLSDRPEWKMNGQLITVTLPITDPVSVIKAKISTEFGMPTGKQKLQIGNIFIKDSNSLGFYNIANSTVVILALKERGGRKR